MKATRWGIIGTGQIANKFATGLSQTPDALLQAVGSRRPDSARAFGHKHNVPNCHGSYEALARDQQVDAVYIATPHPMHLEDALLCLDHGKAVLCEKPLTINATQARLMVEKARRKGLLLMEAMWSRFLPVMVKLRDLLAKGAIGQVKMVQADFSFSGQYDPRGRLLNKALGGGALLDVGVYTVSLASMVLGKPSGLRTIGLLGQTGVDEQAAVLLEHPSGAVAMLSCGLYMQSPQEAVIHGSDGWIKVHGPWYKSTALTIGKGLDRKLLDVPHEGNGYNYEAAEIGRCLRQGLTESPVMPLDESIAIMETMDAIRAQWPLVYPQEAGAS